MDKLTFTPGDFVDCPPGGLWRIARTSGSHVIPWSQLRDYGPVATMRWDPHDPPPSRQPGRAVLYAATSVVTAAAEVWQSTRRIDPYTGSPLVAKFTPATPLKLLDLTAAGTWAIRHRAGANLPHAPRSACRAWARAALAQRPRLHGLLAPSTMHGMNVVLFPAARTAIPTTADLLVPASDPAMLSLWEAVGDAIGYEVDAGPRHT